MDKVFVVLSHFSDSNNHTVNTSVCFVTCKKSSAEKVISVYEKNYPNTSFEIIETDLFD